MAERYDVVVAGAGPAGLAAASVAARSGARVALVDEQAQAGGQIWRRDLAQPSRVAARHAFDAIARERTLDVIAGARIVARDGERALLLERADASRCIEFDKLVLATGARELLLPFPGWTLPGVAGAGGLQALVKNGWPIAAKRVVVAGSGPLLLAAAATLRAHGARVLAIVEQAPRVRVHAFARRLIAWPSKLLQAIRLKLALGDVPYRTGAVVTAAHGLDRVESIEWSDGRTHERVDCDHLACGFGLVPNVELAAAFGCALDESGTHATIAVDAAQRTSRPDVYAAGEVCGIAGVDAAQVEGAIAGFAAIGDTASARKLLARRNGARHFGALVAEHFALTDRVRTLAQADTLVCRCEDVPFGAVAAFADARAAKLDTRCGMGACQGRVCGAALAELRGFKREFGRPPIFPARLATLALAGADIPLSLENGLDR